MAKKREGKWTHGNATVTIEKMKDFFYRVDHQDKNLTKELRKHRAAHALGFSTGTADAAMNLRNTAPGMLNEWLNGELNYGFWTLVKQARKLRREAMQA